jgi:hypothetical protein
VTESVGEPVGGPASEPMTESVAELVSLLPEEASMVAVIDVAEIREAVDLAHDQGVDGGLDERTQPLADALGAAIPFFAVPRSTHIREALDSGAVTEAASVPIAFAPEQAVVVVRTSQSFDDLAAALEERGYEREGDGDVLVIDEPVVESGATAITTTDDGLFVLAQSSDLARSVAAGEGDGPAAAALLGTVGGPLRVAAVAGPDTDSCIESLAAGWVDPAVGEMVITVDDADDTADLELVPDPGDTGNPGAGLAADLEIETSDVEGRTLRARYTWHGRGTPAGVPFSAVPGSLFRCP